MDLFNCCLSTTY